MKWPLYRPRRGWCLSLATLGITPSAVRLTTTVSPIKSKQTRNGFPAVWTKKKKKDTIAWLIMTGNNELASGRSVCQWRSVSRGWIYSTMHEQNNINKTLIAPLLGAWVGWCEFCADVSGHTVKKPLWDEQDSTGKTPSGGNTRYRDEPRHCDSCMTVKNQNQNQRRNAEELCS